MADGGRRRSMPTHGSGNRAERGAALTSVHVLPDARIATGGPIAPDRLRRESAASQRGERKGSESERDFPACGAGGPPDGIAVAVRKAPNEATTHIDSVSPEPMPAGLQ